MHHLSSRCRRQRYPSQCATPPPVLTQTISLPPWCHGVDRHGIRSSSTYRRAACRTMASCNVAMAPWGRTLVPKGAVYNFSQTRFILCWNFRKRQKFVHFHALHGHGTDNRQMVVRDDTFQTKKIISVEIGLPTGDTKNLDLVHILWFQISKST
jgi:hypothetical protein